MLEQCADHTDRHDVVRAYRASGQAAAVRTDVVENMVHTPVGVGGFPIIAALHRHRIHGVLRTQLVPCHQARAGVAPLPRPREEQHVAVPVLAYESHHRRHAGPLVYAHQRNTPALACVEHVQALAHTHTAVRRGDDHARLAHLRLAGHLEHLVGGRQEDERVDALLHEHAAQIVEFLLCALGLMHHGHRNEHTMSAGSRLNGRQCAHRAVETLATGDHANRARAVRRQ